MPAELSSRRGAPPPGAARCVAAPGTLCRSVPHCTAPGAAPAAAPTGADAGIVAFFLPSAPPGSGAAK